MLLYGAPCPSCGLVPSQSTAGRCGHSWPPLAENVALQPPCLHCVADGDLVMRTLLEWGLLPHLSNVVHWDLTFLFTF